MEKYFNKKVIKEDFRKLIKFITSYCFHGNNITKIMHLHTRRGITLHESVNSPIFYPKIIRNGEERHGHIHIYQCQKCGRLKIKDIPEW